MGSTKEITRTNATKPILQKEKSVCITVKRETYLELLSIGTMSDSFDTVIQRLLQTDHRDRQKDQTT